MTFEGFILKLVIYEFQPLSQTYKTKHINGF
jgi:hypothetical protein